MPQIATYVFFDLETTGLPHQERNRTKVIELSFVATSRRDIENTPFEEIPPVSKLTFVFNPQRAIHPAVSEMTGLSIDLLRHAPIFQQKINSLVTFLEEQEKPVCLVAHNGNTFDFKLLLAEFNDAGQTLPHDLLCVDSLVGFRKMLKGTTIDYNTLKTHSSQTFDDNITDDEDEWSDLNVTPDEWQEIDEICLSLSDISCEDLSDASGSSDKKTPTSEAREENLRKKKTEVIKRVMDKKPTRRGSSPQKRLWSRLPDNRPSASGSTNSLINTSHKSIRVVDVPIMPTMVDPPLKQTATRECYKLSVLYKRLLNKDEENAHRAEADCLMLLYCFVALKADFLPWADDSCKMLTEIKPLQRY